MNNPVGWFEIYVDNLERAQKFYEQVFDIELESLTDPTSDNLQMLALPSNYETYGASGALVYTPDIKAGGNSTMVYFSCEDCAFEESKVIDAGGKIERSKMSIGEYGCVSIIMDTEGNIIGLHSQK